MNKEFIPYEQALAFKELGFNEPCFGWFRSTLIPSNFTEYFLETEFDMNESPSDWVNSNFLGKMCSAPLYQQAFRFFREKYGLYPSIISHDIDNHIFTIVGEENYESDDEHHYFNTPEEAQIACLIKLIQIAKTL